MPKKPVKGKVTVGRPKRIGGTVSQRAMTRVGKVSAADRRAILKVFGAETAKKAKAKAERAVKRKRRKR